MLQCICIYTLGILKNTFISPSSIYMKTTIFLRRNKIFKIKLKKIKGKCKTKHLGTKAVRYIRANIQT